MEGYWQKQILVLGCGNVLFGDDGFGPAAADYINRHNTFDNSVGVLNVGTSVREILFTLVLSEPRPQEVIILDAIDAGRKPGEIFEIEVDDLPHVKVDDFSMHQLPTSNLLKELQKECGVIVKLYCTQIETLPKEVAPGLSRSVENAIPSIAKLVTKEILEHDKN